MTRMRATLVWLCAGHALAGGLYWLLLQVPESNAWMLASSLLIVLAVAADDRRRRRDRHPRVGIERADGPRAEDCPSERRGSSSCRWRSFGCVWWLTGRPRRTGSRVNAGEVDAWIIATLGWTKTASLHASLAWALAFVRYGIGTSLAIALLGSVARQGVRGVTSPWLRHGLAWKPLAIIAAVLSVGVWLPWQAVYWRPASLPPTWVQPAFAAVKLVVLYLVGNLAWAVVLRAASRQS